MNKRSVIRAGAIGFMVAVLMFIVLIVILLPFDLVDPVEETLKTHSGLSSVDVNKYLSVLPAYFAIDSILIIGWIVGWIGLSVLIQTRNRSLGTVVFVIGLIGPLLDFVENEIAWAMIESHRQGLSMPADWYLKWKIVRQLSYLIPFAAAPIAAIGLWSRMLLNRVTASVGTVFVAIAILGLYIPALAVLTNIWWLIWFSCLALLLWQRSTELLLE